MENDMKKCVLASVLLALGCGGHGTSAQAPDAALDQGTGAAEVAALADTPGVRGTR
jgi:hypothetical protein